MKRLSSDLLTERMKLCLIFKQELCVPVSVGRANSAIFSSKNQKKNELL